MVTSELAEMAEEDPSLSEDSEREILEMVEEQLDRPNPPGTKVLYRRAMHFIDRDVRHLSLQQFNAKFPLRVKRRWSQASGNGGSSAATDGDAPKGREIGGSREKANEGGKLESADGDRPELRLSCRQEAAAEPDESNPVAEPEQRSAEEQELRREVRSTLLDFAKDVAGAEDRGKVIEAAENVDSYVERIVTKI